MRSTFSSVSALVEKAMFWRRRFSNAERFRPLRPISW